MTNKTNKGSKPKMPKQPKKKTPFANVGRSLGSMATAYTGIPGLKGLGALFGSKIGSIFGSGDYVVAGPQPKMNVLSGSVPQFSTTQATNVVCHREFIGDITGTAAFTNRVFPLNPGDTQTFPWLSTVAANYSQYRFHGVVFEFKPLITDYVVGGAPGVIVLSTNYNADDAAFVNKRQMENSEFATSVKPTENLMHMIECDPKQTSINELYVRVGSNPSGVDKKTTDLANFQLATQGNPVQLLGELWVTYCVEFFKPEVPTTTLGFSSHITRYNTASITLDMGLNLTSKLGSLNATTGNGAVNYFGLQPLTNYMFMYKLVSAGVVNAVPSFVVGPGTTVAGFADSAGVANTFTYTTGPGAGSTWYASYILKSDATGALVVNIVAGTLTLANNTGFDIYLTTIEQTVN